MSNFRRRAPSLRCLLALTYLLHAPFVFAQTGREESAAEAQRLFQQGLSLSAQARWQEARDAFTRSLELFPRASTYYNLAVSSFELGLNRATLDALTRFNALVGPGGSAEYVGLASELRRKAQARMGTLALSIAPAPALVEIDGEALGASAEGEHAVWLDPGVHRVRVSQAGFVAQASSVTIRAENTEHLRIELSAESAPAPLPSAADVARSAPAAERAKPLANASPAHTRPADKPAVWRNPLLWVGIGVVVAGGAGLAGWLATRDSSGSEPYGGSANHSFR